jgi:hypothetical protein
MAASDKASKVPAEPAPPAPPAAAHEPASHVPAPSVLERMRRNRMGVALGALVVAVVVGLALSILVPDSHVLLALVMLGALVAFAVGFTVRTLDRSRGYAAQATALVTAAIGTHLMATTGLVNEAIDEANGVAALLGSGTQGGLGWDDAVLTALATPTISTGALVAGVVAAIIAGWARRD